MAAINCYEILGISQDADMKEINSAYKRLALRHHPDKTGVDDASHEFQKIQEAVETLRDPSRRSEHDRKLRNRQHMEAINSFRSFHTRGFHTRTASSGWSPGNATVSELHNMNSRYMYSYWNGVHMNPDSPESKEEIERIKREREFGEKLEREAEQWEKYEAEQGSTEYTWTQEELAAQLREQEREAVRKEAMNSRVMRDKEEIDNDETEVEARDEQNSYSEHENLDTDNEDIWNEKTGSGEQKEATGHEGYRKTWCHTNMEECDRWENYEEGSEYDGASQYEDYDENNDVEELHEEHDRNEQHLGDDSSVGAVEGQYEDVEEDLIQFDGEGGAPIEENERPDDSIASTQQSQAEYDSAKQVLDSESGDLLEFESTGRQTPKVEDDVEDKQTETDGSDVFYSLIDEQASQLKYDDSRSQDIPSAAGTEPASQSIEPFVPYFKAKLEHPSGRYTQEDLYVELKGLVMESFCGWLEDTRLDIPGAKPQEPAGDPSVCRHLGLWDKNFMSPECEVCHRWMPIYTLSCPGCGKKACVGCKFQYED
ncbi:DnaJ domain-containing protein [Aspergillus avenaceus]|uniref:DnaJ domain-containing protein n=1 Tax=Aspergillus avenaceus TaxID=36643 RepID=A0A5N6TNX1_ASPAV|nr:DnaJ domain-containing protein [Aspergillus avenaceus]